MRSHNHRRRNRRQSLDDDSPGHVSEDTEGEGQQGEPVDAPDPEREQAGRRFGWQRR